MKIDDKVVMNEVRRMIYEGRAVLLPVAGRSMLPFIRGGSDRVELHPFTAAELQVGTVVLAWVDNNRYVIHRIVERHDKALQLLGDGNLGMRECCNTSDVIAVAKNVEGSDGRRRSLTDSSAMAKWRLWHKLRRVRRVLLLFFK